jgi:hypothetical protein
MLRECEKRSLRTAFRIKRTKSKEMEKNAQ